MSLFFAFLFIVCWLLSIIYWIRMSIISSKLKGVLQTYYPFLRFTFGFSMRGIPLTKMATGSIAMVGMFFTAGAKQSVLSWLDAFMDVERIQNTSNPSVNKYFNQLVRTIGVWVKAFVGMFVSIGLAGLFN